MFSPTIRLILVVSCLGFAFMFYTNKDFENMGLVLLAAGLFIYGYFKYGTVYTAFEHLKDENYEKAEELISKIKNPNHLTKQNKSYYHFTNGIIAIQKKQFELGRSELIKALDLGPRTKNNESIILLNLAYAEFELREFHKAEKLLNKLKELKLKPLVKLEADKLREKINVAQHRV